jgi:hypothetical protein
MKMNQLFIDFILSKKTPDGIGRSLNQLKPHVFRLSILMESMLLQLKKQQEFRSLKKYKLIHLVSKCDIFVKIVL